MLASRGAPTENMYATDVTGDFWNLGYELFRDQGKMKAHFIESDLSVADDELHQFEGAFDILIANQIFHLFPWDKQVQVIARSVSLTNPASTIIGYQMALPQARPFSDGPGSLFIHDLSTFKQIWGEVEAKTNTTWNVTTSAQGILEWGAEPNDVAWMPPNMQIMKFECTRLLATA